LKKNAKHDTRFVDVRIDHNNANTHQKHAITSDYNIPCAFVAAAVIVGVVIGVVVDCVVFVALLFMFAFAM